MSRHSLGSDDDMLDRSSSSARGDRFEYTSLLQSRDSAKDKEISELKRRIGALEDYNNSLVKGLVTRTDAAHALQEQNQRIRSERDEAVALFEEMVRERPRSPSHLILIRLSASTTLRTCPSHLSPSPKPQTRIPKRFTPSPKPQTLTLTLTLND